MKSLLIESFSQRIAINDVSGTPIIVVIPDMPQELKNSIMGNLMHTFSGQIVQMDSKAEQDKYKYQSIHFTWYNRFAKKVRLTNLFNSKTCFYL